MASSSCELARVGKREREEKIEKYKLVDWSTFHRGLAGQPTSIPVIPLSELWRGQEIGSPPVLI